MVDMKSACEVDFIAERLIAFYCYTLLADCSERSLPDRRALTEIKEFNQFVRTAEAE